MENTISSGVATLEGIKLIENENIDNLIFDNLEIPKVKDNKLDAFKRGLNLGGSTLDEVFDFINKTNIQELDYSVERSTYIIVISIVIQTILLFLCMYLFK